MMNSLIEFFVRRRLFGYLLCVFILVVGIISAMSIRRDVFPLISFDVITIDTLFPGATPEEVERLVTNRIEQELQEVDGIKRLKSVSVQNLSKVSAQLDPDETTEFQAKQDIQDVIDRISDFPEGVEDPRVRAVRSSQQPIIEVSLSNAAMTELELRQLAHQVEKELEMIVGVARVVPKGKRDLEIRVEPRLDDLRRYQLSIEDVVEALRGQNVSIPGGTIRSPKVKHREQMVRTVGEFSDPEGALNTVIRANDLGRAIRVRDVASAHLELKHDDIINKTNGQFAISLTVLKKEKADAINLVRDVKARMAEIKSGFDPGVEVAYVNDLSFYITNRLGVLSGNLMVGLVLVVLMLSLILPTKVALMVALAIPFSFLGALIVFYNLGMSINLISMLGLIIVVGMLVDNSIVIMDNALRYIEEGLSPEEAAIRGTQEIWRAVTAAVMTTVVVFVPMLFMSGIFGKFVGDIPRAVIIPLVISALAAFFILPSLVAAWIKKAPRESSPQKSWNPFKGTSRLWDEWVMPRYSRLLDFVLLKRYWVLGATFLVFVAAIFSAASVMRFILFPPDGVEIFYVRARAEVGTSLRAMERHIQPIEKLVAEIPDNELDTFVSMVGIQQQDPNDPNTVMGSYVAQVTVYLTPENSRDRLAAEIIAELREKVDLTYKDNDVFDQLVFERVNPGPPVGKPVDLGVRANDYEQIMEVAEALKKRLATIDGVTDIQDSYTLGKQELIVSVDSAKAAAAGLNVANVGRNVRAAFEGLIATSVRGFDEDVDVRVVLPEKGDGEAVLGQLRIANPRGNLIPLSEIASVSESQGISAYEHEAGRRQVSVTADIDLDKNTSRDVNAYVASQIIPEFEERFPGVTVHFGGEDEDTRESMQSLGKAFALAVMGVFLILVLTFSTLLQPLLVLLAIPFGLIAVVITFFLHGMPLSFMGILGTIALGGVIVNNAIVFIDFINRRREQGMDRWESIKDSAKLRLRPIFLTTATTVAGLMPTAYGIGGLDRFVVPVAMSLGWGLLLGSLITAIVFPAAVAALDDISPPKRAALHK